jgi:hypothetical protein
MTGLLARLRGRARARRAKTGGAGQRSTSDDHEDAGPRIDAARQRLKQTIPPPEDPDARPPGDPAP